jgi:hypothetical protein
MTARETGAVELPTDEMIEAGCEAMAKVHAVMRDRNLSDEPESMDDFDEGDVCRAVWLAMQAARPQPTPSATGEIVERLRRKVQVQPAQGSGGISFDRDSNMIASEMQIWDDGKRYANPDGPEAAALIEQQAATIAELRSALGLILNGPLGSQAFRRFALCIARATLERTRGQ